MPRIFDISPSGQSHGGAFSFDEGNGRVVDCWTGNNEIPGFGKDCGYFVEILRLDHGWNPVPNLDTVVEFLKAGTTTYNNEQQGVTRPNWHPGQADSREDPVPEIGNDRDLGDGTDVRGNCLISQTGKGPDAKGKLSTFTNSAIEAGVKDSVFKFGFAPDLVGLEAHFTQFMMPKVQGSTAKRDPTCLIIGQGGKPAGGASNVHKYPDSMTGGAPNAGASASGKTNAAQPVASAGATASASAGAGAGTSGSGSGNGTALAADIVAITTAKLLDIAVKSPKDYKLAKLASMVNARLAAKEAAEYEGRTSEFNQLVGAVQKQLYNEAWLKVLAADNDWAVTGAGTELVVSFPKAS